MSVGKRIVKNTSVLATSHVLSKILYLVLILILTRYLGTDGFGLYSFALAYTMLFMPLTHMGMNSLLIREIARNRDQGQDVFSAIWPVFLSFSLLTMVVVNALALIISETNQERTVIGALSIFLVFDSWSRFCFAVFRGHERLEYEAVVNIAERVLIFFLTLFAWWQGYDIVLLMFLFAAAQVFKTGLGLFWVRRHFFHFSVRWDSQFVGKFLRESFPFLLFSMFGILSIRIDLIMLKYFFSDEIVGIYNTGRRIAESLYFVPEVLYSALFPALSALYFSERKKFNAIFQQSFQLMFAIALPITISLSMLAPAIIALLFEPAFFEGHIALSWLAINLGILFVKHICVATLGAVGKQREVARVMFLTVILNIMLNYMLIPQYGITGAGVATVIAETITFILILLLTRPVVGQAMFSKRLLRIALAAIAMGVSMFYIRDWNLFVVVVLGSIMYLVCLIMFKAFTVRQLLDLKQWIGR